MMLCYIGYITFPGYIMSIGPSGRIVIEVEPNVKRELYSALAKDGLTLKNWFLVNAASYLDKERTADKSSPSSEISQDR